MKSSQQGVRMIQEADLMEHLREWDSKRLGLGLLRPMRGV